MNLVAVLSVLAVMATGTHVLAVTTPALAEQARQKGVAAADTERSIVPNPTAAAGDGLPVPALAGGIVLAFAVGLGAGHVHRRRRRTAQPRPSRAARRAAAHAAPARPAPPPPEPAAPAAPVVIAPPVAPAAPVPPPPKPRRAKPRVVVPVPAAPAEPPAPPPAPDPFELFGRTPRPFPDAHPTLAEAPEVPRPQDVDPTLHDRVAPPLEHAPEALRPPRPSRPSRPSRASRPSRPSRPSAPAPASPPRPRPQSPPRAPSPPAPDMPAMTPARRFARLVPWPEEATAMWTCEIDWKAGYRKSSFRAMAEPPGSGKRRQIGESRAVRWTLMSDPEPPTPELVAVVRALMGALEAAGWERIGPGGPWYAQRFLWRGAGEPAAIAVADPAQAADPPPG